jgi:hypothetical protein
LHVKIQQRAINSVQVRAFGANGMASAPLPRPLVTVAVRHGEGIIRCLKVFARTIASGFGINTSALMKYTRHSKNFAENVVLVLIANSQTWLLLHKHDDAELLDV